MKNLSVVIIAFFCVTQAQAAVTHLSKEVLVFDPGHVHLKMLISNSEIVVDHVNALGYEVYGPAGLAQYLNSNSVAFTFPEKNEALSTPDYPSAEASLKTVQGLAQKYPELITLFEIGKSVEGRSLTFARVTAPGNQGQPLDQRPEFKYIANMHGDEIVGREIMVSLIADLSSQYGKDDRITRLLNTVQIYILPSMNPDGATHHVRYNANGTDLNRSFPDFTTSDNQNTFEKRDPEIQAIMKFQAAHHFKLSANFHGGAEVVNYPWDAQPAPFPLDNLVKRLSLDYSKKVPYLYHSTEFSEGITNGYAWYEVKGVMQDWSYHWHQDLQLTIELTNVKWPAFTGVQDTYLANKDALLTLIEDIHQL